ncbi:high-affinity iron transporter [Rhodopseudomonas julia]|uniref:High-affinity iron transporter n=1 Tax=Rhodopseudomonas julia TaxID=200617 RepID=A0ABU0CA06_9BRAD|nr:FTR1 family protein [Rhodopseudomonas julia]MDQ0326465.1 high-affinity iron transporter [Rhodopseudomonas julia]
MLSETQPLPLAAVAPDCSAFPGTGRRKTKARPPLSAFAWPALLVVLLLAVFFAAPSYAAEPDYRGLVTKIEERLAKAADSYEAGDAEAAKDLVQGSYFEIFENLEGPIRINISAKRSYELEAEFGDIRQAIIDGVPAATVRQRIEAQIAALEDVVPQLEEGVHIKAETGHAATTADASANAPANAAPQTVEPYWQQAVDHVGKLMSDAADAYENGNADKAKTLITQAQFEGYKNSLLETVIRRHVSQRQDAEFNAEFTRILGLVEAGKPPRMVRASGDILVADIEDDLPGLPLLPGMESRMAAASPASSKDWQGVIATIDDRLTAAIATYRTGDIRKAIGEVQDTYFDVFEGSGMEAAIGARDTAFKTKLEGHFTKLVGAMRGGLEPAALEEDLATANTDFKTAAEQLGGGTADSPWTLFVYSLTIILREGFEAMLVVTAMLTYLEKIGHREKKRVVYNSVIVALVLSVATAILVQWVFDIAASQQEILEGATMLIATVVLFTMSYWLISKAEAQKWTAYLKGKIGDSLSTGSLTALWLAGFLAVYREGAETVLFYKALAVGADASGGSSILAGFIIGLGLLAIIYFAMSYGALKLPIRPFFIFTSALLYYLAFVFAGKGVMELIEGKILEPTLVAWVPQVPLLGIFPYVQTLAPQLVLIALALLAIPLVRRSGRPAHAG